MAEYAAAFASTLTTRQPSEGRRDHSFAFHQHQLQQAQALAMLYAEEHWGSRSAWKFLLQPKKIRVPNAVIPMALQAGTANVELFLNGEELPGSPFPAEVSAGPVFPASCTLEGPDLVGCVLGATCSFLVASRDAFGNLRGGCGDTFHVSGDNTSVVAVQSQSGGLYKVGTGFP